jgi:hypothetical protein
MNRVQTLGRSSRGGGALIVALVAVMVLAGMAAAMLALSSSSQRENRASADRVQAFYVAEAGLSSAIAALDFEAPQALFGSQADPIDFGDAGFWGTSVDNGDNTRTITAYGTAEGLTRGVQVLMTGPDATEIYNHALFAGNSSGDPTYTLEFGGCDAQADYVEGGVYSGGDVEIACDAKIDGDVTAAGVINGGGGGTEGTKQPIPDIPGMNYPVNHDINVEQEFDAAWYASADAGGKAWQVDESSPAHIFRLNPDDRQTNIDSTSKDDYFLEDPYEKVGVDKNSNGTDAYHITLSGWGGEPGPEGSGKVYYIDGNLWIHNLKTYSFKLYTDSSEGTTATFVVKGNIYFSDNIFYKNQNKDGIAFIAMKDENEKDSGNIYFGDPTFGTLEHMESFMYAENDFYDNNLSASGSAEVKVYGNMTAGNQVLINRDYGKEHSKLEVEFDSRIMDGSLSLPGLPGFEEGGGTPWTIAAWHEVAPPEAAQGGGGGTLAYGQ